MKKLASSEARNAAVAAISSGLPARPSGVCRTICAPNVSSSSLLKPSLPTSGVWVSPGLTTLTRMPRGESSAASVRPRDRTAAFVAEYTLVFGRPDCATTEALRMIDASSESRGRAFWTVKNNPRTLMLKQTVEVIFSDRFEWYKWCDTGVGKQHVDSAELLLDLCVQSV